ncbi:MAG: phosphodiesterase [Eubacteriales bacterium]
MKLMIASDIHGSAFYGRKMLEAFDREGAEKLILLGDILYHGPRNDLPREYAPKEVISLLNNRKKDILAVRGNCDTEVDQMVLEFPILAEYCMLIVPTESNDMRTIYATHGHNYNPEKLLPMNNKDILLNGHTHVPACIEYDTCIYMNPGSVSIPKEESEHSYMIIDNGKCLWKNLEGEIYQEYSL